MDGALCVVDDTPRKLGQSTWCFSRVTWVGNAMPCPAGDGAWCGDARRHAIPSHPMHLCSVRSGATQVWCAITFLTEIRHRPVSIMLVQLTGSMPAAKRAARAGSAAAVATRRLGSAHQKLFDEAEARLEAMDL